MRPAHRKSDPPLRIALLSNEMIFRLSWEESRDARPTVHVDVAIARFGMRERKIVWHVGYRCDLPHTLSSFVELIHGLPECEQESRISVDVEPVLAIREREDKPHARPRAKVIKERVHRSLFLAHIFSAKPTQRESDRPTAEQSKEKVSDVQKEVSDIAIRQHLVDHADRARDRSELRRYDRMVVKSWVLLHDILDDIVILAHDIARQDHKELLGHW